MFGKCNEIKQYVKAFAFKNTNMTKNSDAKTSHFCP